MKKVIVPGIDSITGFDRRFSFSDNDEEILYFLGKRSGFEEN
jgi:hypothetical protein